MESFSQAVTSLRSQSPFQTYRILMIINKSARITPNGQIGQLDKRDALETGPLIRKELILIALDLTLFSLCDSYTSGSWTSIPPGSSRHSSLAPMLRLEVRAMSNRKGFMCGAFQAI
jgi:hypothetical protein